MKPSSTSVTIWAPSLSPGYGRSSLYAAAEANLAKLGFRAVWAPKAKEAYELSRKDRFESLDLTDKVEDFMWALTSGSGLLLAAIGGYNGYQLLDQIDWDAMKKQGVVPVGHSDFTAIGNAYFAKTGMPAWYGTNLRNMGDPDTGLVTARNFADALRSPVTTWKPLPIYKNSYGSTVRRGVGWYVIREGSATGVSIGGNLGTFFLLQGTPYMPRFDQSTILFLEEDEMPGKYAIREFDRKLRSILDQPGAKQNITGLIVGRFLDETQTTRSVIRDIIDAIPFFADKPVIANVEIGHGMPRILLPIGGRIEISTKPKRIVVYNPVQGSK